MGLQSYTIIRLEESCTIHNPWGNDVLNTIKSGVCGGEVL